MIFIFVIGYIFAAYFLIGLLWTAFLLPKIYKEGKKNLVTEKVFRMFVIMIIGYIITLWPVELIGIIRKRL